LVLDSNPYEGKTQLVAYNGPYDSAWSNDKLKDANGLGGIYACGDHFSFSRIGFIGWRATEKRYR
jgi:hypothetical protein